MRKDKRERTLNGAITIGENNNEFEFQLKKKHNLWWLLLLLLPLVLLIPLKKDITVITQTTEGKPVPNVDVDMEYTASYLLWDGKFLVDKPYNRSQTTDEEGKTVFKGVGFSVYSFIFKFNRQVVVTVDDDRFEEPVAKRRFHTTRKVVFEMEPRYSLTFRTMLEVEGEIVDVLPDCDLVVTVDGEQVEPDNSGSGTFTVDNLKKDSEISIVASKEFYIGNSSKVRDRVVEDLLDAAQLERDIPLGIELECGAVYESASEDMDKKVITRPYCLGKPSGRFIFKFRTREAPDELEVWNCRPEEISSADPSKYRLFKWTLKDGVGGCTPHGTRRDGTYGPGIMPLSKTLEYSNGPFITVVGFRNMDEFSNFDYVVCCEGDDCDVDWSFY